MDDFNWWDLPDDIPTLNYNTIRKLSRSPMEYLNDIRVEGCTGTTRKLLAIEINLRGDSNE